MESSYVGLSGVDLVERHAAARFEMMLRGSAPPGALTAAHCVMTLACYG
jgi:hypothetical protein